MRKKDVNSILRKVNFTCQAIFANAGLRKTKLPGPMVLKLIFMPPGEMLS